MVQTLQIAALALPVADGIINKFELAYAAEIGNGKYRSKDRLQADIIALVRQKIHLQELLVRIFLNLDQIRNRDRGLNLGKINSFGSEAGVSRHRISKTP